MKAKTIYLNRHVLNPEATDESPNRIGTIVRVERLFMFGEYIGNCYHIQFRDYKDFWSIDQVKKNSVKF